MTLKLEISPITEKLRCLLAPQLFLLSTNWCCSSAWITKSWEDGSYQAFCFLQRYGAALGFCVCMVPPTIHMLEDFTSVTRLWDTSQL